MIATDWLNALRLFSVYRSAGREEILYSSSHTCSRKKEKKLTASIKPSVSHKVEVKKLSFDHGPFPYAASILIDIFIQSFNPLKTLFTKVKSKQKIYCWIIGGMSDIL